MKQIGVIGAGAAGLCSLRHLLGEGFTPIAWEHGSDIGGTWIYTENTGLDEHGFPIHSSMYKSLKTNLPKEIMAFPDFPFKKSEKSFIHHTEVLKYLQDYTESFNLRPFIQFNHHVEYVEPVEKDNPFTAWDVSLRNLKEGTVFNTKCDGLVVCNGHYSVPKYPAIVNMNEYEGKQMHSHNYRDPDSFAGLNVLVLGASASGMDISLEVAKVAEKVFLSHNLPVPIPSDLPSNLRQVAGATEARPNGFVLTDGSFVAANAIIFCTGYEFTFPFLSPSCGVTVEENQVKPLYKHLIHSTYPSMAFIGIPFQICPFPIFDVQVQYWIGVLEGRVPFPPPDISSKVELSAKHPHQLGSGQWEYMAELAEAAEAEALPTHYRAIWDITWWRRIFMLTDYKDYDYFVEGRGQSLRIIECRDGKVIRTSISVPFMKMKQGLKFFVFNIRLLLCLALRFGYRWLTGAGA